MFTTIFVVVPKAYGPYRYQPRQVKAEIQEPWSGLEPGKT